MEKLLPSLMFCLVFLSMNFVHSQNVTINNQVDLDNFDPSITTINGNLLIQDSYPFDIVDLSGLSNITSIEGNFQIINCGSLTNLDGLSNIQSILKTIVIRGCHSLVNTDGFSGLTTIQRDLRIINCQSLTNVDGFSNLQTISHDLVITGCSSFVDTDGFSGITSISGNLEIGNNVVGGGQGNPVLSHLDGFSNLNTLGGTLIIGKNNSLSNIDGLSNLTSIGAGVIIESNATLTNLNGLSNLTSIDYYGLEIVSNDALVDINGLGSLAVVDGDLSIRNNNSLISASSLTSLTTINQSMYITDNPSLMNLDGLSNLSYVGDGLFITDNIQLLNIDGLANITFPTNRREHLLIMGNHSLTSVNVFSNITTLDLLRIGDNALTSLDGFSNLTSVSGLNLLDMSDQVSDIDVFSNLSSIGENGLSIYNTHLTNINGLSNLTAMGGNLFINGNDFLENIDALSNITSANYIYISSNDSLEQIDGLSNITSVDGYLKIIQNNNLQNLDGLSNVTYVREDLDIYNNNNLSDCCGIQQLLNTPGAVGYDLLISNNAFPCNNVNNLSSVICDTTVLYVDIYALGSNTGSSWSNAFRDLQDALAIGEGKTIHIAEGTYHPTVQNGLRGADFSIPNEAVLIGGYPSGGGFQNAELYETILSGNIDPNSIDGDSYHVITINNVDNVQLNGLTIRDGNANDANSYARSRAGGVYINNSTAEFKNVDFKWNRGIYGGATFAKFSDVTFEACSFKKNRADYGAAMYYSNASNINLLRSEVIENTSNNRCAIESNNASSTIVDNSIVANNASANANALGIIATNRDASIQILNSTILGETKNKNLITYQVGNNDQLDVTINNSIIAHQNPNFDKNMIAYNNNILNLNHNNCYFSGSSTIGNGTNVLYADMAGDLLLNVDFSLDECSPAINAGSDALGTGSQDYFGNPRYFNTIDIGAYEAQTTCITPRKMVSQNLDELNISLFPNPATDNFTLRIEDEEEMQIKIYDALSKEIFQGEIQGELTLKTKDWFAGIYYVVLTDDSGEIRGSYKVLVRK